MPFTRSHLLPTFAALDEAAMSSWPFARAMAHEAQLKGFGSRQALIESMVRETFDRGAQNEVYLKVVDEESGEMVAAAGWRRERKGEVVGKRKEERSEGGEEGLETVFRRMGEAWGGFREEWFAGEEIWHLVVLVTHPYWQRRGAGSMLVEWGCKKADEEGLKCALHASAAGLAVYTKHGFEIVKETEFDLSPYGVEGVEIRRAMIRMPKGQKITK
ncbi:uncharacterized protein MYCGRDRAFT_90276 [Zymoseptoria tritici IPO323]|uniref:N-acetyltransferase domain-containing protein n=1 Tax=Zymoseptoria tritici (strain CBS 115943 / IPO323) TaxID=336722 RepID=F9X1M0_ZYMTI|nr:uncharacterized protein MYCGRDRAFT_90276 [Zymoseptoria tritici IPO323]EGP91801.1 hypothetical protein MYCGRDRAFT_90276 [Zymoseptoria tritici IPO323]